MGLEHRRRLLLFSTFLLHHHTSIGAQMTYILCVLIHNVTQTPPVLIYSSTIKNICVWKFGRWVRSLVLKSSHKLRAQFGALSCCNLYSPHFNTKYNTWINFIKALRSYSFYIRYVTFTEVAMLQQHDEDWIILAKATNATIFQHNKLSLR